MCRVLGITNFDVVEHRPIIERFCRLAHDGIVMEGDPPGHEDGWGLAFYEDGQLAVHKSGACLLDETEHVFGILEQLQCSPLMIIHLRKSAWKNTSNTRHAHPFQRGNTVFFHNGVVYDYDQLLPTITAPGLPNDARDTEVFFYHILSHADAAGDLGQGLLNSAAQIRPQRDYSALNTLLSDGQTLYAYRDYGRAPEYYSLYKARNDRSWLISSEPLDENLEWEMMAQQELLVLELEGRQGHPD